MPIARLALLLLVGACAHRAAPADPTARVLFRDLERQVTVNAATGWGIDRLEVEAIMEGTLDSVCRVEPHVRRTLLTWLDGELARLGGPVDAAWKKRGKKLSAVDDLLVLTRIRLVLARAEELANECPFWLEPETPFRGRQISERRFQLTFGIYAGAELGASASFPKDEVTGERSALVIGADFVVPVVYRHTLTNAYVEFEAGYLGRSTEQDWSAMDHGIPLGAALGARALGTRFLFPGVARGVSWERTFLDGEDVTAIKVGARVAFDLDL